jgi:hypothetical protein
MEAIKSFLNNLFKNMSSTQEVVRAKEELLQMMEDTYTELRQQGKTENEAVGAVISEFGNLEELAPQLGIAPQVTASLDPENNIAMDSFDGFYWTLVVIGYLAWSFMTNRWAITWIVWPIAGVLYGVISALLGAIKRNN